MIEISMETLDSSNYETYKRIMKENLKIEFDKISKANNVSEDMFEPYFSFIEGFIRFTNGDPKASINEPVLDPTISDYYAGMRRYVLFTGAYKSMSEPQTRTLSVEDIDHIANMCYNFSVSYMESEFPKSVSILQPCYINEITKFYLIYLILQDYREEYKEVVKIFDECERSN